MKKTILAALLLPSLWIMQSCDDPQTANKYNHETTVDAMGLHFIETADEAGHTEIRASKVAEKMSSNPRVVSFAKMMIHDHAAAGQKLDSIKADELVHDWVAVNAEHRDMIDSLAKLSGSSFDKAYMQMMVADHEDAVDLFRDAKENRRPSVKKFARETLPTIEMHLDSAKAVLASLK